MIRLEKFYLFPEMRAFIMSRRKSVGLGENVPLPSKVVNIEEHVPRVLYKGIISYDENGEIVSDVLVRNVGKNKGGFVMAYTAKMDEFIKKTATGSVVRVFIYLANHQGYGVDGVFGYRCSRQHICDALGLTRKSVYSALEYLIKEFLVNEIRIAGTLEYMVNPAYVTVGSNRTIRNKEWSQRWEFYFKRKHSDSKEVIEYAVKSVQAQSEGDVSSDD